MKNTHHQIQLLLVEQALIKWEKLNWRAEFWTCISINHNVCEISTRGKGISIERNNSPWKLPIYSFPCTNLWTITEKWYPITEAYSEVIRFRIYIQLKNKNKTSVTHIWIKLGGQFSSDYFCLKLSDDYFNGEKSPLMIYLNKIILLPPETM